jgi:mRNA interferase MazF
MVGDVIWAKFPFTDLSSWKTRPVLVVADVGARNEEDWLVCEITTSSLPYAKAIPISRNDVLSGRLQPSSRVRPDRIATLNERAFSDPIGRLTDAKLVEILTVVRGLF